MLLFLLTLAASFSAAVVGSVEDVVHGHHSMGVSQPFRSMVHARQRSNATSWPYGPLRTRGRNIVNTRGDNITFAGVSWPLSGKTLTLQDDRNVD